MRARSYGVNARIYELWAGESGNLVDIFMRRADAFAAFDWYVQRDPAGHYLLLACHTGTAAEVVAARHG